MQLKHNNIYNVVVVFLDYVAWLFLFPIILYWTICFTLSLASVHKQKYPLPFIANSQLAGLNNKIFAWKLQKDCQL